MVAAAAYGYSKGDPIKLITPIDSDGRFCGQDEAVKDYPFLFYPPDSYTKTLCVKACPTSKTEVVDCVPTTEMESCPYAKFPTIKFYDK